ncbi:tspO/MBR family protein [Clostridium sp. CAG:964]|nr:tspO/MBR family protein [Clostridium sp. CAG:964]
MNKNGTKKLTASIAIGLGTGLFSVLLTLGNFKAYSALLQPPLAPPGWLFPVVWTILYILMGVSAYLVYECDTEEKYIGLAVYVLQLIFNFLWLIIFFNIRNLLFAFVWLVFLWILVLAMTISFYKVNKTAGLLQIPYLLWVTFAGYLNIALYILNK